MAEASISVAQGQFICSICLDLLKNPVTIPCGHSYCMNCITNYWNYLLTVYNCPQCRQTFSPRPALNKNVVMAEMVENLKTQSYAGPGDVECDVCNGKKYKAVKSCLVCLESYCQSHFERHEEFHSGRRHKVTDATGRLKQMICSKHDKQLEIYCRTDQCCICYLCTMDEHRNHDTVAAVVERTEKQKQLEDTQRKFQQTIQDRQKNLQELKEALEIHGHSTQTAVEYNQRIFAEPMYATEIRPVIRDRENTGGLLGQLEQEIEDLKTREVELKQLSITNDHIYFLQCFQSLISTLDGSIKNSSLPSSDVQKSVSELKEKLERLGKEEEKKISDRGEATPSPPQRSQHPLPTLQPPPSPPPPSQLPPRPLQSLPLPPRLPPPSLQLPPAPPQRSQHTPPPLPSLPPPPSPPPPLRLQHSPTPLPSLQSPPTPFRSQHPLPPPSALRSQQALPPIPPSLRSQQPPKPPPKPLRLQFPLPPLQSQNSVESPPPLPPPLRSQNSLQSPPPLPPPLQSQNSLQSPPPLPPPLWSQNSLQSPPPLPPPLRSQNSVASPPPLPPPLRSQNSPPPPLPPSLRSHH